MTELPSAATPFITDSARRRRWLSGMTMQLEAARVALVDLPDSEGPESMDAARRRSDDLLADGVHEQAARARRALREALELIHATQHH